MQKRFDRPTPAVKDWSEASESRATRFDRPPPKTPFRDPFMRRPEASEGPSPVPKTPKEADFNDFTKTFLNTPGDSGEWRKKSHATEKSLPKDHQESDQPEGYRRERSRYIHYSLSFLS